MKPRKPSPKRRPDRADPLREAEDKLSAAEKRIKKLERELANRNDEIDLLKKAERFFQRKLYHAVVLDLYSRKVVG